MSAKRKKQNNHYILLTIALLIICVAAIVWSSRQTTTRTATTPITKTSTQQQKPSKSKPAAPKKNTIRITCGSIELPSHIPSNDSLIYNHEGRYTLQYSPHYRSALWVAYKLTLSDTKGKAGRSSSFTQDKEIIGRGYITASNADYKGSGYDKGHLLPSADRQRSEQENRATFILSNCPPQLPALNRGTWKRLEEKLRRDCHTFDTIYVVAGTIFTPSVKRLGKAKTAIASYFFKATLSRRGDKFTPSGYIMPHNEKISGNAEQYQVPLDSIERLTGLKLFPSVTNY